MNYVINIHEFLIKYNQEYSFLYDHEDNVAGYMEAVDAFDDALCTNENFAKFVSDFGEFRKDPITSDREAAAFMFALTSFS